MAIGDETNCGKIKSFFLNKENVICFNVDNSTLPCKGLNDVHLLKKIITEDGFEIDRLAMVWVVDTRSGCWYGITNIVAKESLEGEGTHKGKKLFYNLESCEKYIEMNKPRFSKKMILDAEFDHTNFLMLSSGSRDFDTLPPLITIDKNKLGL